MDCFEMDKQQITLVKHISVKEKYQFGDFEEISTN